MKLTFNEEMKLKDYIDELILLIRIEAYNMKTWNYFHYSQNLKDGSD